MAIDRGWYGSSYPRLLKGGGGIVGPKDQLQQGGGVVIDLQGAVVVGVRAIDLGVDIVSRSLLGSSLSVIPKCAG